MWVRELHLRDFRSFRELTLVLDRGPVVILGANGQGKTNIVEAIGYCAQLDSHRVSGDAALIRVGADRAIVRLGAALDGRDASIELELNRGTSNRARVNGSPIPRPRDVLGLFHCVTFAPEDLRLVRGEPGDRRRYLDTLMVQAAPRYAGVRADFERALKQRNALLRTAHQAADLEGTLAAWDARYVPLAAELTWGRINAVAQLREPVAQAYRAISPAEDVVTVAYSSATPDVAAAADVTEVAGLIAEALRRQRVDEIRRAVTLVGPHRDDMTLVLTGHPAKGFASQGESWSLALALQLAAFRLLASVTGGSPVLVLDDVFAELDELRRTRLLAALEGADQVIVTAAVAADVPTTLKGRRFAVVRDGTSTVTEVPHDGPVPVGRSDG